MNLKYKYILLIPAIFFLFVSVLYAVTPPIPDTPKHYIVDLAGIVDDAIEYRLNGYLQELEQKTTVQFIVLTIKSLEGEPLEEFSVSTAHDKWRLGQKEKDNGLLLVISLDDKKYRFEVGYGLEGILPDSLVGSIGRKFLVPNFINENYSKGVYETTLAIINEIALNEGVEITGMPKIQKIPYNYEEYQKGGGIASTILSILFIIGAIILFIRHPRLFLFLLLFSSMGGRRGWSGGGGFGSGGFGGFGGGGGGGFGGGGASGGW